MLLKIKVIPRSAKSEIIKITEDSFRIKIKSPPIDGKANTELIKLISKYFNVPKSNITIKKGLTAKNKILDIRY